MLSTIRIRDYAFSFPSRYEAGHQLTEGEAQAMNALLCDQVRGASAPRVEQALLALAPGEFLSLADCQALEATIRAYVAEWQFPVRSKPRPRWSTLELEARAIARELTEAKAIREHYSDDLTRIESEIDDLMWDGAIQTQARVAARLRREAAARALDDLLADA